MVGEVRWARTGAGSSWKLSGGSMLSLGVTKVSKKRQVRRAISRSARRRPRVGTCSRHRARWPAHPSRDRRRRDPQQRERSGQETRPRRRRASPGDRDHADDDRARHPAIISAERGIGADRRLRRRHPLQEMAAGDEQSDQGANDRVGHQPGLVREERHDQQDLQERAAKIGQERGEVAARADAGMARPGRRQRPATGSAARSSRG